MPPESEPPPPRCLYCRYSLAGLPDGSICPECGMQSVPEALRREVWQIVDSPRRLWGEMISLVRKHPPGWWWALDRPGDLRRCLRLLIVNLLIAGAIAGGSLAAVYSVQTGGTYTCFFFDPEDQGQKTLETINRYETVHFPLLRQTDSVVPFLGEDEVAEGLRLGRRIHYTPMRTFVAFRPTWEAAAFGVPAAVWLVCLWVSVSLIGLWTQIRRGLPKFAKPPKTIIAATCVESCKLVYLSVAIALAAALECVARYFLMEAREALYFSFVLVLVGGIIALGVLLWVGALRSDYTRQLVRSRVHLVRVLVMYALITPLILLAFLARTTGLTGVFTG